MTLMPEFLRHTNKLVAPSGYEMDILDLWASSIRPYVDEVYTDTIGNVIAYRKGRNCHKIMLAAHSDEIGLIIRYIDERGFLYFDEIGAIDTHLLPGRRVTVRTKTGEYVHGIIGAVPIHLKDNQSEVKELTSDHLWIDINAKNKKEAEQKIRIGDVAVISSEMIQCGSRLTGRAMDNRCSLSTLISVARSIVGCDLDDDIYFVATVQEELRARGAQTAAYTLKPDVCIVLDVTHATDYPSMSAIRHGDISLGKGAVIAIGPNMTPCVSNGLIALCEHKDIPHQIEAIGRPTGTDANTIQLVRSGIAVGLVSIPCRYMHSPVEIVDNNDLEATAYLLSEYMKDFERYLINL